MREETQNDEGRREEVQDDGGMREEVQDDGGVSVYILHKTDWHNNILSG